MIGIKYYIYYKKVNGFSKRENNKLYKQEQNIGINKQIMTYIIIMYIILIINYSLLKNIWTITN